MQKRDQKWPFRNWASSLLLVTLSNWAHIRHPHQNLTKWKQLKGKLWRHQRPILKVSIEASSVLPETSEVSLKVIFHSKRIPVRQNNRKTSILKIITTTTICLKEKQPSTSKSWAKQKQITTKAFTNYNTKPVKFWNKKSLKKSENKIWKNVFKSTPEFFNLSKIMSNSIWFQSIIEMLKWKIKWSCVISNWAQFSSGWKQIKKLWDTLRHKLMLGNYGFLWAHRRESKTHILKRPTSMNCKYWLIILIAKIAQMVSK